MQSAEGHSGGFDQGQDSQKHAAVVTTLINAFLIAVIGIAAIAKEKTWRLSQLWD